MKQLLFIGTHCVFRAKYAEAYFNYLAENNRGGGERLSEQWTAISRGTKLKQGRQVRFKPIWADKIMPRHYTQYSKKLQYIDLYNADKTIGMYEPEIKPQLFKETTTNMPLTISGSWSSTDAIETEYWRIPNLIGTGSCNDGSELTDPREILSLVEYNIELLIDDLTP